MDCIQKLKIILALLLLSFVITNLSWFSNRFQITSSGFKFRNFTLKEEKLLAFVTGFSDNHMKEGVYLLDDFIRTFGNSPKPILIFYDLGLSKNNMEKLKEKYGHRIQFRSFDFSNYPDFVKNLFQYRWKPLIVSECLKEFHGVWWMDSSVTFKNDFARVYKDVIQWTKRTTWNMALLIDTGHSIYAATHPGLYKFLNISQEKSKKMVMYGAITVVVMKSNNSEFIIKQWVKCALEKECMAPTGSELYCKFKDRMNDYGQCHRYDQSVINILLAMNCDYDVKRYVYQGYCGLKIVRR